MLCNAAARSKENPTPLCELVAWIEVAREPQRRWQLQWARLRPFYHPLASRTSALELHMQFARAVAHTSLSRTQAERCEFKQLEYQDF
eukprot:8778727-Lingulodinium_polyedra.AAC.1